MTHSHLGLVLGPEAGPSGSHRLRITPNPDARPRGAIGPVINVNAPADVPIVPDDVAIPPAIIVDPPADVGPPPPPPPARPLPHPPPQPTLTFPDPAAIRLFQDDLIDLAIAPGIAATRGANSKKLTLPAIIPGFKIDSLSAGEHLSTLTWP